jgi:predicted neuraminidase
MHIRHRIILLALAMALFMPALLAGQAQWPMPEARAPQKGSNTPVYIETFITPEGFSEPLSHVASLAPLSGGRVAASWYSGSREGAKDVGIYLSKLNPAKRIWSKPRRVLDRGKASRDLSRHVKKIGNSMLYSDRASLAAQSAQPAQPAQVEKLWMFYSTVSEGGWSMSTLSYTYSLDEGLTWARSRRMQLSPALNLTNNVKNKPIPMDDGTFLIPAYHELKEKFSEAIIFDPESMTYRKSRMSSFYRAIQPAISAGHGGELTAIFRNMSRDSRKFALLSKSHDGGQTWSRLTETDLLNPNSGLDTISLSDGRLLVAANDLEDSRHRLSLLVSDNNGRNWKRIHIVEEAEETNEFSYPYLIRDTEGRIHLAYTYNRKRIKHVMFNEAWLASAEGSDG